ncbi:MAG: alpha/beta hydrolase [Firmicutes bacterium]|nr:alpha/beta hydrolase [Bacillota bacterium]
MKALSIEKVILIGASDGGVYARIFAKRHPESVLTMILTTTLTIDSDYVRDIRKERFSTPILLLLLKLVPAKTEMNLLLKKSTGFLKCESEEDRKYGRGFYETVASDLNYKQRFIHSFKCVYMLKDYPIFKESDFEYLRGKIQRQTKRRFTYENCGYL